DKEILLLDLSGAPSGPGEIGEIAVRSRYLSPGYWQNPDLTKSKFLPDPEGSDERIYLTGDLGRMASDGCLEHLGRKDLQVKIRGFTVEVAEIERALLEHPAIREAVIATEDDHRGESRLVAYVAADQEPPTSIGELRTFLGGKLPDYMVPSEFVQCKTLPLTPSGKIDRKALSVSAAVKRRLDTPFVAPTTPVETELAAIWAEVLGLDQVGIHDNFLDLGGHSLMATQIILRVMEAFQIELPLQSLLEAPTVAKMALIIMENQAKKAGDEDLTRLLAELEALSEDEAQRLLSDKDASQP
ncbi:MAG: phosphopantetheine-binding protein, partial [bacterium]